MRQRLRVAPALLGDPGALVFDEPANGLDPEGIRWMRLLMRRLADEGRTVLVSSHVLSEVEQVADNVLVLSKGQLVLSSGIEKLADPAAGSVVVDAVDRAALTTALSTAGFDVEVLRSGLTVRGGDAGTVGAVAAQAGIALSTLVQRGPTLEDVFIELVRGGKLEPRASAAASQLTLAPAFAVAADDAAASTDAVATDAAADTGTPDAVAADAAADTGAPDAVATDAADETLIAEIAEASAVSAAVSESAPSDPAAAAAIAAGVESAHDVQAPSDEDAVAAAAVAEVAESIRASESARPPADSDTDEEDAIAQIAVDEDAAAAAALASSGDGETDTPAPSFDEILFGTAAPAAAPASSGVEDEPVHDISQIFADRGDETESSEDDRDTTGTPEEEAAPVDEPVEARDASDEDAADDTSAGLEIFADLDGESDRVSEGEQSDGEQSEGEQSDEDPRSAAVSSMLAAAARAYYEDEPKDYPLGPEGPEGSEGSTWSVASTGVIDTVPVADSVEQEAGDAPASDEHHDDGDHEHHEHHEHHDGDHHDGEHHGDHEHRQD
jgi:energy-coupling factor transporter ATP-binding protein EcfA2